jgi:hypothetical protein
MHAFFATRGNQRDVELVMEFLRTRVFYLPCTDSSGQVSKVPYTGVLQPIQLWSFVFPKEYQAEVLTALKFHEKDRYLAGSAAEKAGLAMLRKLLRAAPVPPFAPVPEGKGLFMPLQALENIQVQPIGIKADTTVTYDGVTHEAI